MAFFKVIVGDPTSKKTKKFVQESANANTVLTDARATLIEHSPETANWRIKSVAYISDEVV